MLGKIGTVLLVVSLVWFGASLFLPRWFSPLAQSFCRTGETYQSEVLQTGTVTRSGIGTVYVCVDAAGNQRNIREQMTFTTTMVFLVMLFGSFGMIGFGMNNSVPSTPTTRKTRKEKPSEEQAASLSEKLGQLEEAHIKELISEEEYQRLRQETLDDYS